jgi:hypothetical protein
MDSKPKNHDRSVKGAIELLRRRSRDHTETAIWARASGDPLFRAEMNDLQRTYDDLDHLAAADEGEA